jgi:hypothetical protein
MFPPRSIQFLTSLITAWRVSRRYGAVLRLRRTGDVPRALNAAVDGVADAAKFPAPLHAAAAAVLTPMTELTMIADEVAEELGTPDMALPALEEMINYWDRAVVADSTLVEFEHARERIAYFRKRTEWLKGQGGIL